MLSQTQLLMRNLSLCLFLLLASCSTNEPQNELTKATHLERLKKFDQLSNSHALHHLSDSLIKAIGTNDSVFLMKVNYYKGKALLISTKTKKSLVITKVFFLFSIIMINQSSVFDLDYT